MNLETVESRISYDDAMESQFTIPNRSVAAEMASTVTDDSLPSRKRHTDDWEDYEEGDSITTENRCR